MTAVMLGKFRWRQRLAVWSFTCWGPPHERPWHRPLSAVLSRHPHPPHRLVLSHYWSNRWTSDLRIRWCRWFGDSLQSLDTQDSSPKHCAALSTSVYMCLYIFVSVGLCFSGSRTHSLSVFFSFSLYFSRSFFFCLLQSFFCCIPASTSLDLILSGSLSFLLISLRWCVFLLPSARQSVCLSVYVSASICLSV